MEEDDPGLIVTLEAYGTTAERAWNRPQNQDRCKPAFESVEDISSRESTPAVDQRGSRIRLTFDDKPKNLEKGFVFGSDPQICDIFLGERGAGFSSQQFCITFNERGEVIFQNTSRKEAHVNYYGEKPSFRKKGFPWILFEEYENIKITVGEEQRGENDLIFKVKRPERTESCKVEYKAHRDAYLEERQNALPPLSQLGMESQQTTAVLTPLGQQPIYLPKEELGRGAFGTVHKVVNVSTGVEYAGKKFHGGKWKDEVKILKSVLHEHIVQFVDFSEEQGPLLVMEYLPFGNLTCHNSITEEDNLQILYQGLQALEYLHSHSPPLAHRDIKPQNILIQSRTPFVIKLVDFGLAKNNSPLKTFCGTNEYAAPEIWEHRHYTAMVDIWSMGVVVLQYGYGLPRPSRVRKGKLWCQDLVQFAEDMEGEGDALIDLVSTKMLRMDYRHRQSASDCLDEFYRLGFHETRTVDVGCTTPTEKTAGQDHVTRTKSVITQPLQNAGFYDMEGASEMTEVAPSRRDLRDGIHFYNRASQRSLQHTQGATQIWNPQSGDISKSTLSKRRRQQTVQSSSDDAPGRGQEKRSRASVSFEAGEDSSQPPNPRNNEQGSAQNKRSISTNYKGHNPAAQPRQIPQLDPDKEPLAEDVASFTQAEEPILRVPHITRQVARKSTPKWTRSPLERASAPAAEASLGEIETPSSKRNIHDNVRAMLAGKLDGENEGKAKVTDFDERYVQIKIDDKIVLMRKEDCLLNATQILTLANRTSNDRKSILRLMKEQTVIENLLPATGIPWRHSWVNFLHGRILCQHLKLEQKLKPLIDYGLEVQRDDCGRTAEPVYDYITERFPPFFTIDVLPQPVTVRKFDLRINVNHICQASNQSKDEILRIREEYSGGYDIVLDAEYHQSTYVDLWIAVDLCRRYGLAELEEKLRNLKGVPQEPGKEPELSEDKLRNLKDVPQEPVKEPELSEFIEITGFPSPVMVRMSDFRINASHIAKLAGRSRAALANFRNRLSSEAYEFLRGNSKRQGTYVNFDIGLELCREYGLSELEKQLHSLKRTSEGPVLDAEPSRIRHRRQTFERLPESFGSDAVLVQKESTQSREIWNHDKCPTPSGEPITNGLMQVEDACDIDSGSDIADSGGSDTSYEPCSTQQMPQPVPSIHYVSRSQSDSPHLEDDIGVEDLSEVYPISDAASESNTSSSEISTERESEPSSVHLGAKAASLRQGSQYFLMETKPRSPPANNSHYSVWDSRSEHSRLSLFKPDLKPSRKTASPYESFTNSC